MNQVLTLDEVAGRTGEPLSRLRHWCATGKLPCERDVDGWTMRASDLDAVIDVARRSESIVAEHRAVGLAVPKERATPDLAERIQQTLRLGDGQVSTMELALDRQAYVIAMWPAEARGDERETLTELAREVDGELLEGDRWEVS